jgi:hypothetical protein
MRVRCRGAEVSGQRTKAAWTFVFRRPFRQQSATGAISCTFGSLPLRGPPAETYTSSAAMIERHLYGRSHQWGVMKQQETSETYAQSHSA